MVASFCFGKPVLYGLPQRTIPPFEFRPTEFTNDPFQIARATDRHDRHQFRHRGGSTGQVRIPSGTLLQRLGGRDGLLMRARSRQREVDHRASFGERGMVRCRITPWLKTGAGVVTTRADVHMSSRNTVGGALLDKTVRNGRSALIHITHPRSGELMREARERRLVPA